MKYLLFFVIIFLSLNATAQCCPYINSVEVIPANPTTSDNIQIITSTTTPNQGLFLYNTFSLNGNTIDVEACFYSGLLTATQTYVDTLTIGVLPAGNHSIDYNAYQSSDTALCNYTDTMTATINFTVTEQTSEVPFLTNDFVQIYPNPSYGIFKVEGATQLKFDGIVIRAISGAIVFRGNIANEFRLNLDSGTYFVEWLEADRVRGYSQLIIH